MIFSGLLEACLLHILSIQINKILGKLSEIDFSATNKNIYKYFVNLEGLIANIIVKLCYPFFSAVV